MLPSLPRVLVTAFATLLAVVGLLLLLALALAEEKRPYELVRDLLVPLIGPVVAVLVPTLLFYVIPRNQSRERLALEFCSQYNTEEMRNARNVGWEHFVTTRHRKPPEQQAARLDAFLEYLMNPDAHRGIDPKQDEVYQKTTRILDFFAMVNESLARGAADAGIVRSFLLYYYLWWRDEILDPLRTCRTLTTTDPKFKPVWWDPLTHLDKLAK